MRKILPMMLSLLMLAAVPAFAAQDAGQVLTQPLDAELTQSLTIHAESLDIVLTPIADGEAPYVELDTSRLRNADRAQYDLQVTGDANGQVIDAFVRGDDDGGVRLTIYLGADILKNLVLNTLDSDTVLQGVNAHILTGKITDGDLIARDSFIFSLDVTLHDADLKIRGAIGGTTIDATDSDIDIETADLPAGIEIEGIDTDVRLRLPAGESDYTLTYDYEDPDDDDAYAQGRKGTATIGSGQIQYHVRLVDGELDVR